MFAWSSAGRLRPMRMVWLEHNYNEPRYALHKLQKSRRPRLRRIIWRLRPCPKVENDRYMRQRYPGETGRWPLNTKRKRSKPWRRSRKAS